MDHCIPVHLLLWHLLFASFPITDNSLLLQLTEPWVPARFVSEHPCIHQPRFPILGAILAFASFLYVIWNYSSYLLSFQKSTFTLSPPPPIHIHSPLLPFLSFSPLLPFLSLFLLFFPPFLPSSSSLPFPPPLSSPSLPIPSPLQSSSSLLLSSSSPFSSSLLLFPPLLPLLSSSLAPFFSFCLSLF